MCRPLSGLSPLKPKKRLFTARGRGNRFPEAFRARHTWHFGKCQKGELLYLPETLNGFVSRVARGFSLTPALTPRCPGAVIANRLSAAYAQQPL